MSTRARHIVEALLSDAYTPNWSSPLGYDIHDYAEKQIARKRQADQEKLRKAEEEEGLRTEREMRDAGWTKSDEPGGRPSAPYHGKNREAAKRYWGGMQSPEAGRAVYKTERGYVTQTPRKRTSSQRQSPPPPPPPSTTGGLDFDVTLHDAKSLIRHRPHILS